MYLAPDVFIIPEDGGRSFVLYAPLVGVAAQVNAALARLVEDLRKQSAGSIEIEDQGLRNDLVALGILAEHPFPDLAPRSATKELRPSSVSLFLTTACNLGCTYCYASANESPRSMSWQVARAALDLAFGNAVEQRHPMVSVMLHGGGEASLEWELLERIVAHTRDSARERGVRSHLGIGTNGVMSEAHARFIATHFDAATVSLDGPADVHDKYRPTWGGGRSHAVVLRTLKIFDEHPLDYGLRMTVTPEWTHRLAEAVDEICRSLRVKTIQAEPVFPVGRAERNHLESPDARPFIESFRAASKVAARFGRRLTYSGARSGPPRDSFCKASGQSFAVTPTGDVSSCYEVSDRSDQRSNVFFWGRYSEQTGDFLLDQDLRKQQERLSVHGKADCAECFCKWSCAGDCSAKLALLGDPVATRRNPRCEVNRALTKDTLIRAIRGGAAISAPEGASRASGK